MSLSIRVKQTDHSIYINCKNQNWSKQNFPLANLPIKNHLFKHKQELTLSLLFQNIQKFKRKQYVYSLTQKRRGFTFKTIHHLDPSFNAKLKKCFQKYFHIKDVEKIAHLFSKQYLLGSLLHPYTPTELSDRLNRVAQAKLTTRILHTYGTAIHEFLRRLSASELVTLLEGVEAVNNNEQELWILKKGPWDHVCFSDVNLPFKAIKAFMEGHLDVMRLSTILLFIECRKHMPDLSSCTLQLKNSSGVLNQEALKVLVGGLHDYWSSEEIASFIEQLNTLSAEETQFFRIPYAIEMDPKKIKEIRLAYINAMSTRKLTIMEYFFHRNTFHLNLLEEVQGKLELIVTPPKLHEILLKAKFKEQAVRPNPVLGLSHPQDFEREDQRDVLIPLTSLVATPPLADGYTADPLSFYHHDLVYHLFADSANGHREAWIELAKVFKEKGHNPIWNALLDRDFGLYAKLAKPTLTDVQAQEKAINDFIYTLKPRELFWLTLALIQPVIMRGSGLEDPANPCFWSIAFCHLVKHQERWKTDYDIHVEDLINLYKKIEQNPELNPNSTLGKNTIVPLKELYTFFFVL